MSAIRTCIMKTPATFCLRMIAVLIHVTAVHSYADEVYYTLDNVTLADNTQMTGTFSWTFETNDFENGVGRFTSLVIPYTSHNQDDLDASFDLGRSIEITLPGSVHDDGVDIALILVQPLTPTTSSLIDPAESKYEIGGNGFHDGLFQRGRISPTQVILSIVDVSSNSATISWEPVIPGFVLQETPGLAPADWTNSASGSTNPVDVATDAPRQFFRLAKP